MAGDIVHRTGDIELVDVPVGGEAEIAGIHFVRLGKPDWIGTYEVAIFVILQARLVVVVMKTGLHRMARPKKILSVVVGNQNGLPAGIK